MRFMLYIDLPVPLHRCAQRDFVSYYAAQIHTFFLQGAVHDVPSDATAWTTRNARWSMVIAGIAEDPSRAQEITNWAKNYWQAVHPYNRDGGYINFIGTDEPEGRLKATYGENYERLVQVKTKYDPNNVFHINHNIKPSSTTSKSSSTTVGRLENIGELLAQ